MDFAFTLYFSNSFPYLHHALQTGCALMNARKGLVGSAAIAGLIIFGVYLIFGIYLEDNQAIVAAINYGVFGQMSWDQLITDYSTFLVPIQFKVSQYFDTFPVFSLWQLPQVFLWLTVLIYYAFRQVSAHAGGSKTVLLIMIALLVYLTLDSILLQHCIRNSVLLGFAALLLNWQETERTGKTSRIAVLMFLVAVVIRMHSPVIVLALFMSFHVIRGMPFMKVMKHHAAMLAIGAAFILVYQFYGIYTTDMGRYIEANYEYATLEKESLYPLGNMKTAKDSMKYAALQGFLISDSAEFTKEFFERVVNLNYPEKSILNRQNIKDAFNELYDKFNVSRYMLLLLFIVLVFMFYVESVKTIWTTFSFVTLSLAVLLALRLVLVDELKIRFFSPYMGIVLWTLFTINFPAFWKKGHKLLKSLLLIFVLALLCTRGVDLYRVSKEEQEKEIRVFETSKQLHAYMESHPLIAFLGADIPLFANPFYRTPSSLYSNLSHFDGGYLTYFSYVKNRFQGLFGCSPLDYPALINLFEHNKEIRFYAPGDRLVLVSNYFKAIYHTSLLFEPVDTRPFPALTGMIYKVTVEKPQRP